MGISVLDFRFYCTEASFCQVLIFDLSEGEIVHEGTLQDVPSDLWEYDVCSFDSINEDNPRLVLNIETGTDVFCSK